jgi:hypothetical protein
VSTGFGPSTGETSARDAAPPAGVIPPLEPGGRPGFLSDVIVDLGFAERDTVEQAVRAARSPGTTVARVLVETGGITEEQLARALAERYGIDYVDLDAFEVDPAAANLIAPAAARRYQAVPVAFLGTGLLVAVADPADALGVDDVALMTNLEVRPAVASRPALEGLLEALPLEEREPAEDAPPPPGPAASEPVQLREGLESLKHQLAGVEAKLAPHAEVAREDTGEGLRARLAEAEAELEAARMRVREAKEVAAELDTLRERLAATDAGLDEALARSRAAELQSAEVDALRAQLAAVTRERDSARARAREAYAELRRVAVEHEAGAIEPAAPPTAGLAESELHERLAAEQRRRAELEERLAELVGSASAAEHAFGELRRVEDRIRDALRGLGS